MHFVAEYWWLWLLLAVCSVGFMVFIQVQRTQRMYQSAAKGVKNLVREQSIESAVDAVDEVTRGLDSFFTGIKMLIFSIVIAVLSGVLFLVSLIINIVFIFS